MNPLALIMSAPRPVSGLATNAPDPLARHTLRRRVGAATILLAAVTAAAVGAILPASAAEGVTAENKMGVLSSWTQPTVQSFDSWNLARQHQSDWSRYRFIWSTDYCSDSPDRPLDFDFRMPCWRHDFGYRNYKDVSLFTAANKARVDDAFHVDLMTSCSRYAVAVRPACEALAWTYYEAVKRLGRIAVNDADIDRAAATSGQR